MFKIFKSKAYILFFVFFFSLASTMGVYGSSLAYFHKKVVKSGISWESHKLFISKCEDYSTDMKEISKAYKMCKEALKIATKAKMASEENWFNDFKEDYYEYMSCLWNNKI